MMCCWCWWVWGLDDTRPDDVMHHDGADELPLDQVLPQVQGGVRPAGSGVAGEALQRQRGGGAAAVKADERGSSAHRHHNPRDDLAGLRQRQRRCGCGGPVHAGGTRSQGLKGRGSSCAATKSRTCHTQERETAGCACLKDACMLHMQCSSGCARMHACCITCTRLAWTWPPPPHYDMGGLPSPCDGLWSVLVCCSLPDALLRLPTLPRQAGAATCRTRL